jgi:hypothetical protein
MRWSYEEPFHAVAEIKGCVAFYPERVDEIAERLSSSLPDPTVSPLFAVIGRQGVIPSALSVSTKPTRPKKTTL